MDNKTNKNFRFVTKSDFAAKDRQQIFVDYQYHVAIIYNVQDHDWCFGRLGNTDFNLYIDKEKEDFFVSILVLRGLLVKNPKNGALYSNVNTDPAKVSEYLFRGTVLRTYTQSKTKPPCFRSKSYLMQWEEFMEQIAIKKENESSNESSSKNWSNVYDYLTSVAQEIKTRIPQELADNQSLLFPLENTKKSDNCFLKLSDLKNEISDLKKENSDLKERLAKERLVNVKDALKQIMLIEGNML